ncbi:MAG: DUF1538 domain-containing protein [Sphaerochaetaceae bacterium]|jgi:hypothetical protein
MNLLAKIKETVISVVPIMVIVLILHLTVSPLSTTLLIEFFIGGLLLIIGLSIFLLGADIGMLPVGQHVGSSLTKKKNLPVMLILGFVIGFVITVAEPDVQVLASQVATVDGTIPRTPLIMMIAIGVGLFVALGLARIVFQIKLRWILICSYLILFLIASLTSSEFVGIGFDAGGATTGPMTVPFIMALGLGVASVKKHENPEQSQDDSFGLVGIASVGPIMAVLVMGMIFGGGNGDATAAAQSAAADEYSILQHFLHIVPEVFVEVAKALAPLVVMLIIFQLTLLHMPKQQVKKTILGVVYTFIGLEIFLTGVNGGFMPAGQVMGAGIGDLGSGWALVPIGFLFGAVVVCAEPAVWVLTDQVEEVSGGHIRRPVMLATLAIGVAVAVALAMTRVVTGLSIWWYLIPGYAIALAMTFFCPPLFTAIAFDSGGVASGPMSSTFILSFTLGASMALGGNPVLDAFGVVAMIAMTPLIAIQALGLMYQRKQKKMEEAVKQQKSRRLAFGKKGGRV